MKVKAGLTITNGYQLTHTVIVNNIHLTELKDKTRYYELHLRRKGKSGMLDLTVNLKKELVMSKQSKKIEFLQIAFDKEVMNLTFNRPVSYKKIEKKDGFHTISFVSPSNLLEINHAITDAHFIEKYWFHIESIKKEKKKRRKNNKDPNINNLLNKTNIFKKNLEGRSNTTKHETLEVGRGKGIWIARDTSFRRCDHCHFYNRKQLLCGLLSRKVQPNNACSRFYAPKIKLHYGGGFSPR
ncbi:hypothetical protein [Priestia aryabhattai]|uniref:hypothetical protein n=1 Tax=Priestia aryabhattai TaxID=412384 RepID=UPI00203E5B16|nr:hypothetical protein [Priestia aryabhattai]MCM3255563.1 hypothetical protein [Priestia aryabhattai]